MKKIIVLSCMLVFFTFSAFTQGNMQDVIYLKNGGVIRGIIIEQVPNKSFKIQTADESIFVFSIDEVDKIAKEISKNNVEQKDPTNKTRIGYRGIIELGYELGTGDYGLDRVKLNIINGYQINSIFSVGLGMGFRYYYDAEALLIPIFADFRATFLDRNISPYFSFGIGYSFDATNELNGVGLMLSPNIGISFKTPDKNRINVGLGYEIQNMEFYYYDYYSYYSGRKNCGALSLNVGISF
ncbi:hypothetical protein LJC52_04175 [Bacteroidales bacterium OttesenSCG-928-A17]|nr:hypothetical protein [Bacteroidales bacterium OttesenSCG-928-A17]